MIFYNLYCVAFVGWLILFVFSFTYYSNLILQSWFVCWSVIFDQLWGVRCRVTCQCTFWLCGKLSSAFVWRPTKTAHYFRLLFFPLLIELGCWRFSSHGRVGYCQPAPSPKLKLKFRLIKFCVLLGWLVHWNIICTLNNHNTNRYYWSDFWDVLQLCSVFGKLPCCFYFTFFITNFSPVFCLQLFLGGSLQTFLLNMDFYVQSVKDGFAYNCI